MTFLKLQRPLALLELDEEMATFGRAAGERGGDVVVAMDRGTWVEAGQPLVITLTVEAVR